MPKPREPLRCIERVRLTPQDSVPPGWIHATQILLRGMERLRLQEQATEVQT